MASIPHPAPDTEIAIVTVSYGSEEVLSGFLDSVAKSTARNVAVVIADNKAETSVRELASRHGARYLRMPENLGYGAAVNSAVSSLPADVRWVLISNPDITLGEGAIDKLVARGNESEKIGAVGPRILDSTGAVYPSARAIPSIRTGVGHALLADIWPQNPWSRKYKNTSKPTSEIRQSGWLSGACLLVRRDLFADLGGFDTGYFMYFEDVDLGLRINRAGYLNLYVPDAVVTHSGAHSTSNSETASAMVAAHHESAKRFLGRKYPGPLLAPLRWLLGVGLDIRSRFHK